MIADRKAVLLMAYGSPASMEEIGRYYTHIRRGNPPTVAQLEELQGRYRAIGGSSPLSEITARQAAGLALRLRESAGASDDAVNVYVGYKHIQPFISETVARMADEGVLEAVGIVLAPHYSAYSVGVYIEEAQQKAEALGMTMTFVRDWYRQEPLNEALAIRLQEAVSAMAGKVMVVFTAHSLPKRILKTQDPYPSQLMDHCEQLAKKAEIKDWRFAWQSAGRTQEPWLDPELPKVMREVGEQGYDHIVVCPLGFIADHLEVLYDLDVEAMKWAQQLRLRFSRTRSLNDDPLLIESLFRAVTSTGFRI